MKVKKFYEEVAQYSRELNTTLKKKQGHYEKESADSRMSKEYLRSLKEDCTAFERSIKPSLRDHAVIVRQRMESELHDAYSPGKMRLSDNIKAALDASDRIKFSADEWRMLMEDCRSDADRRAVRDSASLHGFTVTGYTTYEQRLADFDRYVATLTAEPEPESLGEVAPKSFRDLCYKEAYDIYLHSEDVPEIVCYRTPDSFESVGEAITAETAKQPQRASADEIQAFREGADIDRTVEDSARAEAEGVIIKSMAKMEVEKHKQKRAEEEKAVMREAFDNIAFDKALNELSARQAAEEAEAAHRLSNHAASVSAVQPSQTE